MAIFIIPCKRSATKSFPRIPDRGPGQALIRGNPGKLNNIKVLWIPAFAGMTVVVASSFFAFNL